MFVNALVVSFQVSQETPKLPSLSHHHCSKIIMPAKNDI